MSSFLAAWVCLICTCFLAVTTRSAVARQDSSQLVSPGAHVILISIDTLRADHLGCYGYKRATSPRIDAFADRAFVFQRAYTHSPNTITSHASMLTSLHPASHGTRTDVPLSDSFVTLAEAFARGGYESAGLTTMALLSAGHGFAQGFDTFHSQPQSAEQSNQLISFWLAARQNRERPLFLFIHYYDVHSDWGELPYETKSRFDRMFVGDYSGDFRGCRGGECASKFLVKLNDGSSLISREELAWVEALYDGGIAYTDAQIGALLDRLKEAGYFESSWVVVTADHGEEFMEHGRVLHTQAYQEVARVPLIIKPPRSKAGGSVAGIAGLVDLMPTLLEAVGIEPPKRVQGRSLLAPMGGRPFPYATAFFNEYEDPGNITVRRGNYTLVTRQDFTQRQLYDVEQDPAEKINIAESRPKVARRLVQLARDYLRTQLDVRETRIPARVQLKEQDLERLRMLGYVE